MNLLDVLLRKASTNELGHFYILEPSQITHDTNEVLLSFMTQFLSSFFKNSISQESSSLENNPDIFFWGLSQRKDNSYTIEELSQMNDFLQFRSLLGLKKFIIIPEAHKLTPLISNKLLKVLEEPPVDMTFFLLNPRKQKLLETIHSRGIHLRIPNAQKSSDQSEWTEILQDSQKFSLSDFLDKYSKSDLSIDSISQYLIQWESEQLNGFNNKESLEIWLKSLHDMNIFNQPTATKWTLLYYHLQEYILPRLRD
jgi:formate dehydrogenase maturation protein FdhE